jgi:hypothetical protein
MANFNFPTQPQKQNNGGNVFPSDLLQGDRQYYTSISFSDYSANPGALLGGGSGYNFSFGGQFKLPLPKRIVDNNSQIWSEYDASTMGSSLLQMAQIGGAAGGGTSYLSPLVFMTYKRPTYKEHELQWTLSASNKTESNNLKKMIKEFKASAAPKLALMGAAYKYPKICQVTFNPKDYLFALKPCAVITVSADYTAAGGPSFYKSGAPTVVGLTLRLREIQLWTEDQIRMMDP